MADKQTRSHSRQNSARRGASANQPFSSGKSVNLNRSGSRDLLSREEEYKRLNEELEAKTANLVKEAEQVMREQDDLLSKPSLLDNINSDDFLDEWGNEADLDDTSDIDIDRELYGDEYASASGFDSSRDPGSAKKKPQPSSARTASARSTGRPPSKNTNKPKPVNATKKVTKPRPGSGVRSKSRSGHADVALVDDDTFMTSYKNFSFQDAISNIESNVEDGHLPQDEDDEDIMPSAAAEMGAEAQIRFLKAKLRVMQEELDRLSQECNKKEEVNNSFTGKIKEIEDERNRLQRTNAAQQTQIDRYKRLADDAKGKAESLETQCSSIKKELEATKRSQKQQNSNQSVTEVRLNRALEEVEKYKTQLQKAKTSSKDTSESEKRRIEQLMAENKRLEKQKSELITGFKKQMKLIDILKRQKIHIEAAKMLAFTEEEFVKALEWGN